jgi:hypothetical protein
MGKNPNQNNGGGRNEELDVPHTESDNRSNNPLEQDDKRLGVADSPELDEREWDEQTGDGKSNPDADLNSKM